MTSDSARSAKATDQMYLALFMCCRHILIVLSHELMIPLQLIAFIS